MNSKPLAYDAYQKLADSYSANIDTKPHNAYYDRPAVLSLLPSVDGQKVLDAGCGPGAYAKEIVARGAHVTAIDASDRMLELAQQRIESAELQGGGSIEFQLVDMSEPLSMFGDQTFEVVMAPLSMDYIEDWKSLFSEFHRVLKPGGVFVFSCGHPAFDAEYFDTKDYFSVEQVQCVWEGFGTKVMMPSYRRSLEEILMPVIHSGFVIERVHEPLPTEEFKNADPARFERLMHRPGFLCVRAAKH